MTNVNPVYNSHMNLCNYVQSPKVCEFIIVVRHIFVSSEFRTVPSCFCPMKLISIETKIVTVIRNPSQSVLSLSNKKNTQMLKCVYNFVHSKGCFYHVCKNDIGEVPPKKRAEKKLEERVIFMHLIVKYYNVMKKPTILYRSSISRSTVASRRNNRFNNYLLS